MVLVVWGRRVSSSSVLHIFKPGGALWRIQNSQQRASLAGKSFPVSDLGLTFIAGPKINSALDIVAVHGLAANPHRTWTWRQPSVSEHRGNSYDTGESSDTQINWLQDLLPASVAKARIFAFNYASDWVRDAPMEDLRNVATKLLTMLHDNRDDRQQDKEKPLIFIAHSFGGLVVQEALVLAAQNAKYHHLINCTHSIFFLGTPHRGTQSASVGVTLGFCAAALGLGSNTKLLEALKQGSLYLDSLVNDFVIQSKELGIDLVCFYELYKTKVSLKRLLPFNFTMMVVDKGSATIPGWRAFGMHADHSGLNKFHSKRDANFELFVAKLRERAKKAPQDIRRRIENLKGRGSLKSLHFIVPHARNNTFTPRPTVSKKLASLLKRNSTGFDEQCRLALYGLSGSGTTQRALNLAYSNKGKKHVFWLDANTIDSFNQTLTTVGRGVGLADDGGVLSSESDFLEYTRDWLGSERSGDWLMIVDGANNPTDEHVNHWHRLLQSKRGTVIFTSCTAKIVAAVGSPDRTIEIGPMAFPEASKLFQKVSGLKIRQNQEIEKLLDLLEYLPHAISQAASYIRERHITIVAYTDMIRKANDDGRSALLQTTISNVNDVDTLPRSIMTTWDLSFSQIQEVNPSAIELLRFMSLIGPNIPLSVVRSAQLTKLGIDDDLAFHEAMGLLASYRLVIPSHSNHIQGSTYRLHSLVGLRTRTSVVDKSRLIGIALDAVEQLFPEPDSSKRNTKKCAGMLQHAQAVLRHSADFPEFEPIRNALKYKVELHQFYAYEYKKRKVDILASKATAKTVSQPGQHSEDPSNQGILQLLSKIENETKVGQHHFTEKSDILADLEWAKNWAR